MTSSWKIGAPGRRKSPSLTSAAACFRLAGVMNVGGAELVVLPPASPFGQVLHRLAKIPLRGESFYARWAQRQRERSHSSGAMTAALSPTLPRTLFDRVIGSSLKGQNLDVVIRCRRRTAGALAEDVVCGLMLGQQAYTDGAGDVLRTAVKRRIFSQASGGRWCFTGRSTHLRGPRRRPVDRLSGSVEPAVSFVPAIRRSTAHDHVFATSIALLLVIGAGAGAFVAPAWRCGARAGGAAQTTTNQARRGTFEDIVRASLTR